jgi:hypothetical protein
MRKDLKKLRATFTPLYADATKKCPAWYAMDATARALFFELKLLYNRDGEGSIGMSARQAARLLGIAPNTAVVMFRQLEHYGFAVKMIEGYLGPNGKGVATQWRLTDEAYLGQPATLDFRRWDGTLFDTKAYSKKQNPVSTIATGLSQPLIHPVATGDTGRTENAEKSTNLKNPTLYQPLRHS